MLVHTPSCHSGARKSAFTLVELLVVIGVIALLISILLPALSTAREAAVTIKCLARIRELGNGVQMYAAQNKGSFPPIMEAAIGNSAGTAYGGFPTWAGGPCIFPVSTSTTANAMQSGYLSQYIGATDLTNKYVCPALADRVTTATNGQQSYRYNRYLGGMPDSFVALPANSYSIANWRICKPYKLSQVKQSSNFAVFVEQEAVANFYGSAGNSLWFRQDSTAENNGSAPYGGPYASPHAYQLPTPLGIMHQRRLQPVITGTPYPGEVGYTNISFADGSARTIRLEIKKFPVPAIDGVWVRPEHPSAGW